jgi:CPA2 family monovalent cation:H+ antiporter-2
MKHLILTEILTLLLVAVVILTVFRRLHLPSVLGYLVVGLLAGPVGLGVVPSEDQALLAEFGVVFLLFSLGLEFSLPRVIAMKRAVFGLGGLQVLLTMALFGFGAWQSGLGLGVAIVVGGALALSSTALVIKQLSDQLEWTRPHGHLATGILLFQDLAAVPLLALIPLLAATEAPYTVLDVMLALVEGALVLAAVLAAGRWLLRPLLREIAGAHVPEIFTLAVLLVVLGAAWATSAVGLSLALGAFLAGMLISETEFQHHVEADIRPFRDVLLGLFFVTIGMRLDPRLLVDEAALVALLLAGLLVAKALVVTVIARRFADDWRVAARTGLAVAQGGEFGLAMISLAASSEILAPQTAQPVLAALVLSMLVSPFVIRYNAQLTGRIRSAADEPLDEMEQEARATGLLATREHVVICGYGRVGQNVARLLEEEGFEYIALDLDPGRVRRARKAGSPVFYGDAGKVDILEGVGLAQANAVVISFPDPPLAVVTVGAIRSLRQDVPILVRTPDDSCFDSLHEAGASVVVPESIESSLILSAHALNLLAVPLPRIIQRINGIRRNQYLELRQVFPKDGAARVAETYGFKERLGTVSIPPGAFAIGRRLDELALAETGVMVNAIRRPTSDAVLKEGDVVVLYGSLDGLARAEARLLIGDGRHRERSAAVKSEHTTVRADEAPPARRRAHRPDA